MSNLIEMYTILHLMDKKNFQLPIHGPLALDALLIPQNFKTPFFSRYQKFLSWGNLNGSRTRPNFFQKFFSTNMVARGLQSFYILEGATDPLIEQWLKFSSKFSPDMWWTYAENFKSISWVVSELWSFNWKILAFGRLPL